MPDQPGQAPDPRDPFAPIPVSNDPVSNDPGSAGGGSPDAPRGKLRGRDARRRVGVDPGGATGAALAWGLGLLAFLIVAGMQNLLPAPAPADPTVRVQTFGQAELTGKVAVKMFEALESLQPGSGAQMRTYVQVMKDSAFNAAEVASVPIVAFEIDGAEGGLEAVDWARRELNAREDALAEDASEAAIESYELAHADLSAQAELFIALRDTPGAYVLTGPGLIDADRRALMVDRLGVFGELIVALDAGDEDELEELRSGGWGILVFGLAAGLFAIGVLLASVTCFVLALVWMRRWRWRMDVPTPGGSVFLESWALFVGGFLVLILVQGLVPMPPAAGLMLQWLLLLAALWPLARGLRGGEYRKAIGLHRGRGVLREIGVGVFAYLAFLPVYVVAVLFTFALVIVWGIVSQSLGLGSDEPLSNPVLELIAGGDVLLLIALFLLATVWAPLVEELIFRGAMHRHLRARIGIAASGLATGLLFAFMHGYGPLLVPPLIALAMLFALLREWRGSLIAAITAHWLHNFTLMLLMLAAVTVLG